MTSASQHSVSTPTEVGRDTLRSAYRLLGSTVITPRVATRKTALDLASLTRAAWAE